MTNEEIDLEIEKLEKQKRYTFEMCKKQNVIIWFKSKKERNYFIHKIGKIYDYHVKKIFDWEVETLQDDSLCLQFFDEGLDDKYAVYPEDCDPVIEPFQFVWEENK